MIISKQSPVKLVGILLVAIIGAVFLSKYFVKDSIIYYPKSFVNFGSYMFVKMENLGGFVGDIKNFRRLADENERLKQDGRMFLDLRAKIDSLENENDFLRRSVPVSQKHDQTVVYAGIFNLNLGPEGYNVLLNKGFDEGISEGDVVVTEEGELVGKGQTVMKNFSRILFVSDPEFKITTKVLSSDTAGIARGALNDGMYLDFIVQDDEAKEEDLLVSVGSDMFPPALIVGSINHIEANPTQMFKKIRVRPAVKDVRLSRVLVIKM